MISLEITERFRTYFVDRGRNFTNSLPFTSEFPCPNHPKIFQKKNAPAIPLPVLDDEEDEDGPEVIRAIRAQIKAAAKAKAENLVVAAPVATEPAQPVDPRIVWYNTKMTALNFILAAGGVLENQHSFGVRIHQYTEGNTSEELNYDGINAFICSFKCKDGTTGYYVWWSGNTSLVLFAESKNALTEMTDVVREVFVEGESPKQPKPRRRIAMLCMMHGEIRLQRYDLDSVARDMPHNEMLENYPDGFDKVNERMVEFLTAGKSGLGLLHGIPGTGKTSYIRHVLATPNLPREFVYIPVNMLEHFGSPAFFTFLQENPGKIYFVEDAETLIRKRAGADKNSAGIANLLNATDGLLADVLRCQFICTFNAPFAELDEALKRPGRLRFNHEFTKLPAAKAQVLLDRAGIKTVATRGMTLAEIYNPDIVNGEMVYTEEKPAFERELDELWLAAAGEEPVVMAAPALVSPQIPPMQVALDHLTKALVKL